MEKIFMVSRSIHRLRCLGLNKRNLDSTCCSGLDMLLKQRRDDVPSHFLHQVRTNLPALASCRPPSSALRAERCAFGVDQRRRCLSANATGKETGPTPQINHAIGASNHSGKPSSLATRNSPRVSGSPVSGQRHYSWLPPAQGAFGPIGYSPSMGEGQISSNAGMSQTRNSSSSAQV